MQGEEAVRDEGRLARGLPGIASMNGLFGYLYCMLLSTAIIQRPVLGGAGGFGPGLAEGDLSGPAGGNSSGVDFQCQGGGAKRGGGFFGGGGFHGGGPCSPAAFPARGPRAVPGATYKSLRAAENPHVSVIFFVRFAYLFATFSSQLAAGKKASYNTRLGPRQPATARPSARKRRPRWAVPRTADPGGGPPDPGTALNPWREGRSDLCKPFTGDRAPSCVSFREIEGWGYPA